MFRLERFRFFVSMIAVALMTSSASAASVLFVGNQNSPDPTFGDDGFVFDHLVDLGHDVLYLPSSDAFTEDGEEVDLLVLSSTFGSGTVRGKFNDIETPILQWEEALIRQQPGNFDMSFASGNGGGEENDTIFIEEPDHPIVQQAGLGAGEIVVYDDFLRLVWAQDLSPDTVGIATNALVPDHFVLSAIEAGGELTTGELAPGPRVNFFVENTGFANLTEEGLALFDASIDWLLGDIGDGVPELQPGDANQDLSFDQLDIVQVSVAAKYLSGLPATWGEGDWNGAPGGSQGNPPAGNGFFDQVDIIAALSAGTYLTGPYAALGDGGVVGDEQTTLVYDPSTGELSVNAPASTQLTSIFVTSAGNKFVGSKPAVLDGPFDSFAADNIFKSTIGSSFGDISFGTVLPTSLSKSDVLADLSASGSLDGGGGLGDVDLLYVPEPTSLVLLLVGITGFGIALRRRGE